MIFRAFLLLLAPVMARADELIAHIDISDQQMTVLLDGVELYRWPVSTARAGKRTPRGIFIPEFLKRMHYSTLYNDAPMPFSVFFAGNYAIHGTNDLAHLATPVSAGCVRLDPLNAETLFNLILQEGLARTLVVIED